MTAIKIDDSYIFVKDIPISEMDKKVSDFVDNYDMKVVFLKKYTDMTEFEDVEKVEMIFDHVFAGNSLVYLNTVDKFTKSLDDKLSTRIEMQLAIILNKLGYSYDKLLSMTSKEIFEIFVLEAMTNSNPSNRENLKSYAADALKNEALNELIVKNSINSGAEGPAADNSELISQMMNL